MTVFLMWTDFKPNIMNKGALRWTETDDFYSLFYGELHSTIMKDGSAAADQTDFETYYKAAANKTTTPQISPFDAKTDGIKKLFGRSTGQAYALAIGANVCDFTIPYTVCKITGIECLGGELGDFTDFKVMHPTYGVLAQVAYSNYIAEKYYERVSKYDADMVVGLILRMNYTSVSVKNIYVNYLLHELV